MLILISNCWNFKHWGQWCRFLYIQILQSLGSLKTSTKFCIMIISVKVTLANPHSSHYAPRAASSRSLVSTYLNLQQSSEAGAQSPRCPGYYAVYTGWSGEGKVWAWVRFGTMLQRSKGLHRIWQKLAPMTWKYIMLSCGKPSKARKIPCPPDLFPHLCAPSITRGGPICRGSRGSSDTRKAWPVKLKLEKKIP